ncbi:urease accessory protein UreE [Vibrio methylphosphonaticus]|uniref:urease accessory protein UreE n=1 Tax=Vibrio methylphosphonaticus TaxID=2946866 RepID=UPI00202A6242|nr:urease accessory protein UreE [Vibrio methylphosphonaticus]MCL9776839.1 urease accessory protein UreE [Vibrio methylphosphonaticus]
MIELTEISEQLTTKPHAFLSLPIDSRIKSRLKVILDDGRDAGLFLPRGHILRGGEQLKSLCGLVIEVKAAPEKVSSVYCSDLLLLTRVAYHLGNRHVPLQVEFGWVRYQHDHVLDEMVEGLGAKVAVELEPFEPEGGAYGGKSGGGHHHH